MVGGGGEGGGEVGAGGVGGAAGAGMGIGQDADAGWRCLATDADEWAAAGSGLAAGFAVAARVFALQRAYYGGGAGVRALLFWRGKKRAGSWSRLGRHGRWDRLSWQCWHGWWS